MITRNTLQLVRLLLCITFLAIGSPRAEAAVYAFPGPAVSPSPGLFLPAPRVVPGKEFSEFVDRDFMGMPDPEQVVAWDGIGGTLDGLDYSGTRLTFFEDSEIDAIAHVNDALYHSLRADTSFLAFTVGNGSAPLGSGSLITSEGETIGRAGDISFEVPGAITKGVWAVGATDVDSMFPPGDLDGIEVWGFEPPTFDADRYSLMADFLSGVSVWNGPAGLPYLGHAAIVSAVTSLLGPLPANITIQAIDLDALMVDDRDGVMEEFGGPGDSIIFSIRQIPDSTDPDGFYATGSELFTLDAMAVGLIPGFLMHGGHVWDHPYSLSAMKDSPGGRQLDINGIEALSVPEPAGVMLVAIALLSLARQRRRER